MLNCEFQPSSTESLASDCASACFTPRESGVRIPYRPLDATSTYDESSNQGESSDSDGDNKPATGAMFQWFGSNRMLGHHVGEELAGCSWVGVVFAGGMSELKHIRARTLLVNDLHRHAINAAMTAAHPMLGPEMRRRLSWRPLHPNTLANAKERCLWYESAHAGPVVHPDLEWAVDYFTVVWMSRAGVAGADSEFNSGLSIKWNAGGGDSAVRYRSAVRSLVAWRKILRRATFTCKDCFDFLAEAAKRDIPGNGIYCDPPWPDLGERYKYKFDEAKQRQLAATLAGFKNARVVIRYGDHPLIREMYPEPLWTWRRLNGRTQANKSSAEVLILNGPSRAAEFTN